MQRSTQLLAAAAMVASAATLPAAASGQQPLQPVNVVVATNAAADSLHRAALRLHDSPRRYRRAAAMHERSAAMRSASDLQGVRCLAEAGRLRYYAGDRMGAREAFTQSAERAQAIGDVVDAANSYVYAGLMAQYMGRQDEATALGERAELLASSPLLTESQRSAITVLMARPSTTTRTASLPRATLDAAMAP